MLRASHLINDLLDFTQARLGRRIAIARAEVALHDVVAEALDELRLAHPRHTLQHVRIGPAGVSPMPAAWRSSSAT